ncbi:HLA class II histocompatibility antigen gamma chain isoform X1 [Protopterus annectens]|nr:HLA class II histocompatibility antigen gamma chain isoform X1 [Protopterus annectens]
MAEEEQRTLLNNQPTNADSVVSIDGSENRSRANGIKWASISVFVALLIAGQAICIYYVLQQQGQITTLQTKSINLQQEMIKRPVQRPVPPKKLKMAMFHMPLAFSEDFVEKEKRANSNNMTTEEKVEFFLKKWNPDMSSPKLEKTFLENLNQLKFKMDFGEWMTFESWMKQWLLFQQLLKTNEVPSPPGPPSETEMTRVQTKCQLEAATVPPIHLGKFKPKCDEQGDYIPVQCHASTGYCWCVDKNGHEIPDTRTRQHPNCTSSGEFEGTTSMIKKEENMLKLFTAT